MEENLACRYDVRAPYALYTGNETDPVRIKTATGIVRWRRDLAACQVVDDQSRPFYRLADDLPVCDPTTPLLVAMPGVPVWSLVVATNTGGAELSSWAVRAAKAFARIGCDVVGTSHVTFDDAELDDLLKAHGGRMIELRSVRTSYPLGTGRKRTGLRLLTVGSDGVIGKKYTALAITEELKRNGVPCDFRPTGQTGRLIAGPEGRAIVADSIPADFLTGAAEWLTPDNDPYHWDVVEGQANLFHPAWGPDTLGLLLGAQPDVLVFCASPGRRQQLMTDGYPVVPLAEDVEAHLTFARRTNPGCVLVGISVNASGCSHEETQKFVRHANDVADCHRVPGNAVPVFDPSVVWSTHLIGSVMTSMSEDRGWYPGLSGDAS